MFLAIIDQTIVATALPAIAADFGQVERISWVVVSYLVAATIAAPVYGRLGDLLGRRRMMIAAIVFFVVASLLCALARSIETLVAARLLQGLGGGGLMTLSQALIGEAMPPRERARSQGYIAGIAACSNTLGPVAGGLIAGAFGWQWIFLINLPIGILALCLIFRLPNRQGSGDPFRFDAIGLLLFATFVSSILILLERLHRFDAGDAQVVIGLALLAWLALVLLLRHESRTSVPLLPIALLRHPAIWRSGAIAACFGATLVSLLTLLPIYFKVVRGLSLSETGLLMLPLTLGIALGSMTTGRLVSRTGHTALIPSIGLPVVVAALTLLALCAPILGLAALAVLVGFTAMFMGTVMAVVQVTVQAASGPKMLGAGAASVQFSRSIGAALGTAVTGAVLIAWLLSSDGEAAALFARLLQDAAGAAIETASATVLTSIERAFEAAFFTIAGFAAIAMILIWTLPIRRLEET
jgi:EmrB/QacA subfamily drug resistance transporter